MFIIPPVDLAAAASSPEEHRRQARLIDHACRRAGYFRIIGHDVPSTVVEDLYEVSRSFFAQSTSEKAQVAQPAPDQARGWTGVGAEGVTYVIDEESAGDLKEKFDIGPSVPAADPDGYWTPQRSGPFAVPNLWPSQPAGFREAWESYYSHMCRVGDGLLRLAAEAFSLPCDFFEDKVDRQISMLRGSQYPIQSETPLPGQMRAGIHTDHGAFTIVSGNSPQGGLEVLNHDGEWEEVPDVPGMFVGMVGDLFAEWTADRWPATIHRVTNPPRQQAVRSSRLAFAFYQHPNYDLPIKVLAPFAGPQGAAESNVLLSGQYLRDKYLRQTTFGAARHDD
jgi:isopenicillin N synthase-like dioxygenase